MNGTDCAKMTASQILLKIHNRGNKHLQHDCKRIFRRILKSAFLAHLRIVQVIFSIKLFYSNAFLNQTELIKAMLPKDKLLMVKMLQNEKCNDYEAIF